MLKCLSRITRPIFFLIFFSRALWAEELLIEPRINSPDSFYDQIVSLVEGSYSETNIDLVLPGTVPLHLTRYYCSHDTKDLAFLGGWRLNPHCYLSVQQNTSKMPYHVEGKIHDPVSIFLGDASGVMLVFSGWLHFGSLEGLYIGV